MFGSVSVHHARLSITTEHHAASVDITDRVRAAVKRSKVKQGICVVASLHTTAGVFVNENADPNVGRDLMSHLGKLVPRDDEFKHAEGNADAHIKTALIGTDVTIPIRDGELELGRWQGIYLAEFDGPRERSATVTVIGDQSS
jgi:secondary thiamine-phosphate synthase enzyme